MFKKLFALILTGTIFCGIFYSANYVFAANSEFSETQLFSLSDFSSQISPIIDSITNYVSQSSATLVQYAGSALSSTTSSFEKKASNAPKTDSRFAKFLNLRPVLNAHNSIASVFGFIASADTYNRTLNQFADIREGLSEFLLKNIVNPVSLKLQDESNEKIWRAFSETIAEVVSPVVRIFKAYDKPRSY
jgi:hypothetical protein